MGMIRIETAGSFAREIVAISTEEGGHANAIQRAIGWLNDRLPVAIKMDHELHDQGDRPPRADFGEGVETGTDIAAAMFVFMGWLTTREEITVLSSGSDAAPAADLVKQFCEWNGIPDPDMKATRYEHPEEGS